MTAKSKLAGVLAPGLLVLSLAGAAFAQGPAKPAAPAPADVRAPLVLTDGERHLVLDEMRNFLAVLQRITDALPREDWAEIAKAARLMGSGAANEIPPATVAKLPQEFQLLAGGVHTTFDVIALDAETLADPKHTLSQVSDMLNKCNACHGMYQIRVAPGKGTKRR